ncbi:MAG: hypothetical protein ABWX90_00050 [Candidatus Saccharimonadales bacterium]
MNPNNTIVLSTSSIMAPSLLGALTGTHLIIAILVSSFLIFGCLFLVFKRRNQTK